MHYVNIQDSICICQHSHVGRDGSSFLRLYSTPTCLGIKINSSTPNLPIPYTAWAFSMNARIEQTNRIGTLAHLSLYFIKDVKGSTQI